MSRSRGTSSWRLLAERVAAHNQIARRMLRVERSPERYRVRELVTESVRVTLLEAPRCSCCGAVTDTRPELKVVAA